MRVPSPQEVWSMCYERYQRRRREADESRELWREFTETRPIADPKPSEVTEPERTEAREEEVASADRLSR